MQLALIDAIGPFFRGVKKSRINWSKIHFQELVIHGNRRELFWKKIREDMHTFAGRVSALGYTAVTLDDVAHLTDHIWHEAGVREKIEVFRQEFRQLFAIIRSYDLKIFVTADYFTSSEGVDAKLEQTDTPPEIWFRKLVESFLLDFPEVSGIVLRIGESDGHDVTDCVRSRLMLRTASDVNRLLKILLPVFERESRTLIFRTWTVGAYLIGDLIWHRARIAKALKGIQSTALIISMKYGESDFFRYLPLNGHFFRIQNPKIIEFQARREYEGAGEFPSFMGWECERYAKELHNATNVVGFSVWCQTGGWHGFHRLAFLDKEAIWIELNTFVIHRILAKNRSTEEAIQEFFGEKNHALAVEFLQLCDTVIRKLFYVESFATQKLFFRRVRIPPLLHIFWDCIFINEHARRIMTHFVKDPKAEVEAGEAAFEHFERMIKLAKKLDLPVNDILFMRDTFHIILLARRYYFSPDQTWLQDAILDAKKNYKKTWPRSERQRFRVRTSFESVHYNQRLIRWLFQLVIRRQRGYRTALDRIFTIQVLSWMYRFFRARRENALPKFARKTAMGVDALFR